MVSNNDQSSNETSTEELGEHYASEGEVSQDEVSVLGDDRFKSKLDTQETLLHATKKLLSHFGMVFSLGAGFQHQFTKHSLVKIGYRYLNVGNGSLNTTPLQQTSNRLSSGNLAHHLLNISFII